MIETMPRLNLIVQSLRFTLEARTYVQFGPHAGAQIRGALWEALCGFACTDRAARSSEHQRHCPMCRLMALETHGSARGMNPPRPFAIRPPLRGETWTQANQQYNPGETFVIGVNLYGDAAGLFPYMCQAMYRIGEMGCGYGRGQFLIRDVEALHPFTGDTMRLYDGKRLTGLPHAGITHEDVMAATTMLSGEEVTIRFRTPTQLTGEGRSSVIPAFERLVARLVERCQAMEACYAEADETDTDWRTCYLTLTAQAAAIKIERNEVRWARQFSSSRRSGYRTDISGMVGEVTYHGDLAPFHSWLLWGMALHVGKNTAKGNGWYDILCGDWCLEH